MRWFLFSMIGSVFVAASLLTFAGVYVVTRMNEGEQSAAECVLVFGAGVRRNSAPSPALKRRMMKAAELYHSANIERVVLSGGKGDVLSPSEASVMQSLAIESGIPHDALLLEDRSTSTLENLAYAYPLLRGCKGVTFVSDRYHLARIGLLARMLGWDAYGLSGAGDSPPLPFLVRSVAREAVGILYYGTALLVP